MARIGGSADNSLVGTSGKQISLFFNSISIDRNENESLTGLGSALLTHFFNLDGLIMRERASSSKSAFFNFIALSMAAITLTR